MSCSKEALASLFYNLSSSFQLLLFFSYFSSIFLAKLFHFICNYSFFQRTPNGSGVGLFSDEEEEEEEVEDNMYFHGDCMEKDDHLVADIIHGGESLLFLPVNNPVKDHIHDHHQEATSHGEENDYLFPLEGSVGHDHESRVDETEYDKEDEAEEEIPTGDTDSVHSFGPNEGGPTSPITINLSKSGLVADDETHDGICILFSILSLMAIFLLLAIDVMIIMFIL